MIDCTEEIRGYIESQEIERGVSLDVECLVDSAMIEAPRSFEEALDVVDEMIDEACASGIAQYDSEYIEGCFAIDEDIPLD